MALLTLLNSLLPPSYRHHHLGGRDSSCYFFPWILSVSLPQPNDAEGKFWCKAGYNPNHSPNISPPIGNGNAVRGQASNLAEEGDDELEFQVLTAVRSNYNDIVILDTPKSRMLLLDSS
ncbi:unnamed protein product, partial [Ilex paraguariensis]